MSNAMMKFFEIRDETLNARRWHLEEPKFTNKAEDLDFWPLISGEPVDHNAFKGINAPIQQEGRSLSFTLGAFLIPYVNEEVGELVLSICGNDSRLLPCLIGGVDLGYSILVVARKVECLDHKRSLVEYYREDDFFEGEEKRAGKIKTLVKARIDPHRVPLGVHLFRLEEDLTRLIASEALVAALRHDKVSGVAFERI